MMRNYLRYAWIGLLAVFCTSALGANAEPIRFEGSDNGRLGPFTVGGPWLLDWSSRSDFPMMSEFELWLLDGSSGKSIGMVAQLEGRGQGRKMFTQPGTYQLSVRSPSSVYEITITEISESRAAALQAGTDTESALQDATKRLLGRVREGSFDSWRAVDEQTLLLFSDGGPGQRVNFATACSGLTSARALSFVASMADGAALYDSILFDDGRRCYFDRVVPHTGD